jgi:hypothetical protein
MLQICGTLNLCDYMEVGSQAKSVDHFPSDFASGSAHVDEDMGASGGEGENV